MSLLAGARELAYSLGQVCIPLHVFQVTLQPQFGSYFDEPTRTAWNNRTLALQPTWGRELEQRVMQLGLPQIGQQRIDSRQIQDLEREATTRATQLNKPVDAIALAFVLRGDQVVRDAITRTGAGLGLTPDLLAQELESGVPFNPAGSGVQYPTAPPMATWQAVQTPEEKDLELAKKTINDYLTLVELSNDELAYSTLQTVETNTFLTTLALSSRNRSTVICIGQPGSMVNKVELVLAARLASSDAFKGQQDDLNEFKGGLYKIDVASLLSRAGRPGAARASTLIRVAKEKLLGMGDKPILMYDHLEAARSEVKDLDDVRFEVAERGRLLSFGVYHVPDDREHTVEARLGRDNIRLIEFDRYTPDQTRAIINEFFMKLWQNPRRGQNEGRTFTFDSHAFDDLMALEGGAWHDLKRKVLPGLVIDITENALQTVITGENELRQTADGALEAFKELRRDELPRTAYRRQYEPALKRSEEQVKQLLQSMQRKGGFLGIGQRTEPFLDPGKPILITSANLVAELICHNISEFHYPEFVPEAVRELVTQAEQRK